MSRVVGYISGIFHPELVHDESYKGPYLKKSEYPQIIEKCKNLPVRFEHDKSGPVIGKFKSHLNGPNGELICDMEIYEGVGEKILQKLDQGEVMGLSLNIGPELFDEKLAERHGGFNINEISIVSTPGMGTTWILAHGNSEKLNISKNGINTLKSGLEKKSQIKMQEPKPATEYEVPKNTFDTNFVKADTNTVDTAALIQKEKDAELAKMAQVLEEKNKEVEKYKMLALSGDKQKMASMQSKFDKWHADGLLSDEDKASFEEFFNMASANVNDITQFSRNVEICASVTGNFAKIAEKYEAEKAKAAELATKVNGHAGLMTEVAAVSKKRDIPEAGGLSGLTKRLREVESYAQVQPVMDADLIRKTTEEFNKSRKKPV